MLLHDGPFSYVAAEEAVDCPFDGTIFDVKIDGSDIANSVDDDTDFEANLWDFLMDLDDLHDVSYLLDIVSFHCNISP